MTNVSTATPKARKPHRCSLCEVDGAIQVGEVYTRQTNEDGGPLYTWKECQECSALIEAHPTLRPQDEVEEGWARELLDDGIVGGRLGGLGAGYRAGSVGDWREWAGGFEGGAGCVR